MEMNILKRIIEQIQTREADKSAASITVKKVKKLNIINNEISIFNTNIDTKLSIRIIKDSKSSSCDINEVSQEFIDESINNLFEDLKDAEEDDAYDISPSLEKKQIFKNNENEASEDLMIKQVNKFLSDLKEKYPMIILDNDSVCYFTHKDRYFFNSNGVEIESEENYFTYQLYFIAKNDQSITNDSYYYKEVSSLSSEDLMSDKNIIRIIDQVCEQLNARTLDHSFVGDIIVNPEFILEILEDSLLLPFREDNIIDGSSIYLDKLNKKVASDIFTLEINPVSDEFVSRSYFDNDGHLNENMTVIKDGILETFLLSQYGAKKTGFERSKNMGWIGYKIKPGKTKYDDMIKNCQKGILLCGYAGDMPNKEGDLTGIVLNSFYIENGEIQYPIKEVMISSNTVEMLQNITEISEEFVNNGSSIMPFVKISNITVSASEEDE
ncbi:MAG: TldD/PmbA family protein [Candidatus Delongbacteria bacterium]|nr:TldD/PmbA family protein [Candidatus Delongbacteria bacterium]